MVNVHPILLGNAVVGAHQSVGRRGLHICSRCEIVSYRCCGEGSGCAGPGRAGRGMVFAPSRHSRKTRWFLSSGEEWLVWSGVGLTLLRDRGRAEQSARAAARRWLRDRGSWLWREENQTREMVESGHGHDEALGNRRGENGDALRLRSLTFAPTEQTWQQAARQDRGEGDEHRRVGTRVCGI
jgi:hypothetical protein